MLGKLMVATIPAKRRHRAEMQDLEELGAKLLEAARKLPRGPARHDALKEIGRLRAQLSSVKDSRIRTRPLSQV
jgi:hypothetical protein